MYCSTSWLTQIGYIPKDLSLTLFAGGFHAIQLPRTAKADRYVLRVIKDGCSACTVTEFNSVYTLDLTCA